MIFHPARLIRPLLLLYCLLAVMGNLVRFDSGEGAYGLSTIILMIILSLALPFTGKMIWHIRVFKALLILILWMIGASLLASEPLEAFRNGLTLILYLLAAATAARYVSGEVFIMRLLIVLCIGGLIGAATTIIDFVGIVDIPGVNELTITTRTEAGDFPQASGVFPRRTAMAAYYSIIITVGLAAFLLLKKDLSRRQQLFFLTTVGACAISLLLTHNRAGIIGSIIAISITMIGRARSFVTFIKTVVALGFIFGIIALILITWFPDVWIAYKALLGIGSIQPKDPFQGEADQLRLVFAVHTLKSLLSNPIGQGYSLLIGVVGYSDTPVDPHNILTQIVWGAGAFGLVWLWIFGRQAVVMSIKFLRRERGDDVKYRLTLVLLSGLLSFVITGMVHTIISTGVAWILLGALIRLFSMCNIDSQFLRNPSYGH